MSRDVHQVFVTCEQLFPEIWQHLEIYDALDDALERAELRVQAEREEHEEEEDGPQVAPGELVHRLSEQDESQAGAAGRLEEED